MKKRILTSVAVLTLGTIGSSHAALIGGVTVESVSSENGGFNRLAVNSVNGSGLTGGVHSSDPGGTMWMANETAPNITYDLGAVYTINSLRVWNYNEGYTGPFNLTNRGLQDVAVTYGETLALGSTLGGVTLFDEAPGFGVSYTGEEFNFNPITARYINIDASSNYGDQGFSGLSEIQFFAVDPIPEPSSAVLLGLGGFALILRRRK